MSCSVQYIYIWAIERTHSYHFKWFAAHCSENASRAFDLDWVCFLHSHTRTHTEWKTPGRLAYSNRRQTLYMYLALFSIAFDRYYGRLFFILVFSCSFLFFFVQIPVSCLIKLIKLAGIFLPRDWRVIISNHVIAYLGRLFSVVAAAGCAVLLFCPLLQRPSFTSTGDHVTCVFSFFRFNKPKFLQYIDGIKCEWYAHHIDMYVMYVRYNAL